MLFTQSPNTIWTSDRVLYRMPYIADYFVWDFKLPVAVTGTTFWIRCFFFFFTVRLYVPPQLALYSQSRKLNVSSNMFIVFRWFSHATFVVHYTVPSPVTVPSSTSDRIYRKSTRWQTVINFLYVHGIEDIFYTVVCVLCRRVCDYSPLIRISVIRYHPVVGCIITIYCHSLVTKIVKIARLGIKLVIFEYSLT